MIEITPEFFARYNYSGPRYTSYPTAPFFKPESDRTKYLSAIDQSNIEGNKNISFYFHIPFCPKQCSYCGCNTEINGTYDLIKAYLDALDKEMDAVFPLLDKSRPLTQVHFGGGTPNAVPLKYLEAILKRICENFKITSDTEVAIECDPVLLTRKKIKQLSDMGFTRMSFGLQDTNLDVLEAVNREYPRIPMEEIVSYARELGIRGINVDFIYGLPRQSVESFNATLQGILKVNPDRVAVFSYAHMPHILPHQTKMEQWGLPDAQTKLNIAVNTYEFLVQNGYNAIGMDHYSKYDDALSVSQKNGTLHRNFQGYCTKDTTGQVYAFGSSAISQLDDYYFQNVKSAKDYIKAIENQQFAYEKFCVVSEQDKQIREIINSIMCNGVLRLETVSSELMDFVIHRMEGLKHFVEDGIVTISEEGLELTELGSLVARVVAMHFDPVLDTTRHKYSKTI